MTEQSIKASELQEGQRIYFLAGVATAHCALATSMVFGTVDCTTEKAIRIAGNGTRTWLPRKALTKGRKCPRTGLRQFDLARWFRPDGPTARALDCMTDHSVISA